MEVTVPLIMLMCACATVQSFSHPYGDGEEIPISMMCRTQQQQVNVGAGTTCPCESRLQQLKEQLDYQLDLITSLVEMSGGDVTRKFPNRQRDVENGDGKLTEEIPVEPLPENSECINGGIVFNGSCFYTLDDEERDYQTAQLACAKEGAYLAYVHGREAYDVLYQFLQTRLADKPYGIFWLGARYGGARDVVMNDGSRLTWTKEWHRAYPHSDHARTRIAWDIRKVLSTVKEGFLNVTPKSGHFSFCQKELRY